MGQMHACEMWQLKSKCFGKYSYLSCGGPCEVTAFWDGTPSCRTNFGWAAVGTWRRRGAIFVVDLHPPSRGIEDAKILFFGLAKLLQCSNGVGTAYAAFS